MRSNSYLFKWTPHVIVTLVQSRYCNSIISMVQICILTSSPCYVAKCLYDGLLEQINGLPPPHNPNGTSVIPTFHYPRAVKWAEPAHQHAGPGPGDSGLDPIWARSLL